MTNRVVITGVGIQSPLGIGLGPLMEGLYLGKSSIKNIESWDGLGLRAPIASAIDHVDEKSIPRKARRSMSRISFLSVKAGEEALATSGLDQSLIQNRRTGVAFASTMGGTSALEHFFKKQMESKSVGAGVESTTFLKIMSHTAAANVALYFGIPGRVISSNVACTASTQSIGLGYEAIKYGMMDRMLCGGAEELHIAIARVFDVLGATANKFQSPEEACRPFSFDRCGIVVGEGAGAFMLENYDQAVARGAKIYGEILGFNTNCDSMHLTNPSTSGIEDCMMGALEDAGISAEEVQYVNAHGTGTPQGDIAESQGIHKVFGEVSVSSLKGHFGHQMGAAGVIETAACLGMIMDQKLVPTRNLVQPADDCAPLDYLMHETRDSRVKIIAKNSFAFGGINSTLILTGGHRDES